MSWRIAKWPLGCFAILLLAGCVSGARDLRGYWEKSPDGKTLLRVVDASVGCDLHVDGERWPKPYDQAREVQPGVRYLNCHENQRYGQYGFEIPSGVIYTFDYWGP